jgi:hypothetical protein
MSFLSLAKPILSRLVNSKRLRRGYVSLLTGFSTDFNFFKVMEDIDHYDIPVYNFPYDVEEDDEDTIQDNSELRVRHYSECVTQVHSHQS